MAPRPVFSVSVPGKGAPPLPCPPPPLALGPAVHPSSRSRAGTLHGPHPSTGRTGDAPADSRGPVPAGDTEKLRSPSADPCLPGLVPPRTYFCS